MRIVATLLESPTNNLGAAGSVAESAQNEQLTKPQELLHLPAHQLVTPKVRINSPWGTAHCREQDNLLRGDAPAINFQP